jgi:hypothetical protein
MATPPPVSLRSTRATDRAAQRRRDAAAPEGARLARHDGGTAIVSSNHFVVITHHAASIPRAGVAGRPFPGAKGKEP